MKRRWITALIATAVAMTLAIPVGAADLHEDHKGTDCEHGIVLLHFVNAQTDGTEWAGTITVMLDDWDNGGTTIVQTADKVNKNTQHFWVPMEGGDISDYEELINASTDLPGKLVLSDYECDPGKKGKK